MMASRDRATVEKKRATLVASRTRWTNTPLDVTESRTHSGPTNAHLDATGSHTTQDPSDAQGSAGRDSVTEWLTTTLTEDNAKHSLPPSTEHHAEPLRRNPSSEDDLVLGVEASLYGKQGVKSVQELHGKQQGVRTVQEFLRSSRNSPAVSRWNSFNSGFSSHSTPLSVMEVLNLWNDDPEEVLLDLGFGCDEPDISKRIPARFINFQSKARGINIHVFLEAQKNRLDLENPDVGNRFRQLEVLQQVTTAFSSLVGGATPPSSPPGALSHADQSAEARERRRRMGALLRRASKKSLGQLQNAQATTDPTPDQGASTNPSLTTQTSATSQCIGDKRSQLKRTRSSLQENAGLMPLAEEQCTDGPDDSTRVCSEDGAPPRLEPLKEGLHLPPVPPSAVLPRKRSQGQARESFEMEEILSFDEGSISSSYTGGAETTVRGGVLRTNSCQSDSSGFMEEPFIPYLSQQGALTPPGPQLIKALSSLSGDSMDNQTSTPTGGSTHSQATLKGSSFGSSLSGGSMESQLTVRDAGSSAPPSPSLFPPPSVPTSFSSCDQETFVPASSSLLPTSRPIRSRDLEPFSSPPEEEAPATSSPRQSPVCLPTASVFAFDPPKSPSPKSEDASAPDTFSSCTSDSSSLEKGVLLPESMFAFNPNTSTSPDLEDVSTPNTVVVEEEEEGASITEVEPLARSPRPHEELPDPTGGERFGKVKEEEGGHITGHGEVQEESCTSPCSASPSDSSSYAGLEEELPTVPCPKTPSSPSLTLDESAAANSCPQANSLWRSPGNPPETDGSGISPLLRTEDEPAPPPAPLLLATSPDEMQEQRLCRRASPSPPCPIQEDNLPSEASDPSDSDERFPEPASPLSASSPLPCDVPLPSISTRQSGEWRVESDDNGKSFYHPPELASSSSSHGEHLPPVPSAFQLEGGCDSNSAFQPWAHSPRPHDELPGQAGAEPPQSPCHSPAPPVTDSPSERIPGLTEHTAVDACSVSNTPCHNDEDITDTAPTHPPPVSDVIRGETDRLFAAGPEDIPLPQRGVRGGWEGSGEEGQVWTRANTAQSAEEDDVYGSETGGSAALQTETASQEMVRDESGIEPGQMVAERFGKAVGDDGARDTEATALQPRSRTASLEEAGVDSQPCFHRPHDKHDERFGKAEEVCESEGAALRLCSRTACPEEEVDSQPCSPRPIERLGPTGAGLFGGVAEEKEGAHETEEVEPHVIDFVPCDEIPEPNRSRITDPGPIEIESLDLVFETSVDGSDGNGDYGDVDAICRELDSDGYVYWAEPIQLASPSPIPGEESGGFEATPPSRSLLTGQADREPPSTSTMMLESSSAAPRTPASAPSARPNGHERGTVRTTRSVSVQMPSMPSSHSVSHIVHRKDVPYTSDSKPTAPALPGGPLPLDTSSPLSAVQSWTDLQMQRNMLSKQTETLRGPQTSQNGGSTARPLITCGISMGRHHKGHFSSTPSFPSAPSSGWPSGLPSASTRTVRTKSVSLDTGLWPDEEEEEDDDAGGGGGGVEDDDTRWEEALMSGAACCCTCDHRSTTTQLTSHSFPYSVDELEGMMRCIRQFRSVLTDIEEQVCEDQASVYSSLTDADREEVHDITELRRAVKAEAGQLETQLNELACQYGDSIKMKIHRLLDEQSLLCSQLTMLPSSPPTLLTPSSTSTRLLQPPPSLHTPNSTSNHRSVATQCSMVPPWLSEGSQSAPLPPQDTWSRSSPPGSEDICHGLVCSPTKTDKLDFVGFLQRLKESLRHSVNTDSLE